ncbi:MAG: hypothetical protein F6K17_35680 [Okeania sp. SIO3C4]|nr:hypothetical protein [Okeania sp. SIO3C4]
MDTTITATSSELTTIVVTLAMVLPPQYLVLSLAMALSIYLLMLLMAVSWEKMKATTNFMLISTMVKISH